MEGGGGGATQVRVALPFGHRTAEDKRVPYRAALAAVDLEPVEDAATVNGLCGLVLAGGCDLDPALYGASPHPKTKLPDSGRDRR